MTKEQLADKTDVAYNRAAVWRVAGSRIELVHCLMDLVYSGHADLVRNYVPTPDNFRRLVAVARCEWEDQGLIGAGGFEAMANEILPTVYG